MTGVASSWSQPGLTPPHIYTTCLPLRESLWDPRSGSMLYCTNRETEAQREGISKWKLDPIFNCWL